MVLDLMVVRLGWAIAPAAWGRAQHGARMMAAAVAMAGSSPAVAIRAGSSPAKPVAGSSPAASAVVPEGRLAKVVDLDHGSQAVDARACPLAADVASPRAGVTEP